MKTNFDKITEDVDTLVKAMVADVRCKSCIYGQEKRISDRVEYDCYFDSDVCYIGKETCVEGVKEWLKQPLPMNEQYTNQEIAEATYYKKSLGCNYIACDNDGDVRVFRKKPKKGDGIWERDLDDKTFTVRRTRFKYITWKDGIIKLDDIIHSKEQK